MTSLRGKIRLRTMNIASKDNTEENKETAERRTYENVYEYTKDTTGKAATVMWVIVRQFLISTNPHQGLCSYTKRLLLPRENVGPYMYS